MLNWIICEKSWGGSFTISKNIYYVLPNLSPSPLLAAFVSPCVYYIKETNMIKKTTIESQLDCRATATLRDEIAEDLSKPDRPLKDILLLQDEQKDESQDQHINSD